MVLLNERIKASTVFVTVGGTFPLRCDPGGSCVYCGGYRHRKQKCGQVRWGPLHAGRAPVICAWLIVRVIRNEGQGLTVVFVTVTQRIDINFLTIANRKRDFKAYPPG